MDKPDCFGKKFREDEEKCLDCLCGIWIKCAEAYCVQRGICVSCAKGEHGKVERPATEKFKDEALCYDHYVFSVQLSFAETYKEQQKKSRV